MYCFGKGSSFGGNLKFPKMSENISSTRQIGQRGEGEEDGGGGEKEKVLILFVRLDAGFKFALIQL